MIDDLNGIQRDALFIIAGLGPAKGLAIRSELSEYYDAEIHNDRIYYTLKRLIDQNLVEKGSLDGRTNEYRLTEKGVRMLKERRQWEAEKFDRELG